MGPEATLRSSGKTFRLTITAPSEGDVDSGTAVRMAENIVMIVREEASRWDSTAAVNEARQAAHEQFTQQVKPKIASASFHSTREQVPAWRWKSLSEKPEHRRRCRRCSASNLARV